jgi:hypothetical protein
MICDKTRGPSRRKDWAAAVALGACWILASSAAGAELTQKPVTFAKDIAPIFQAKCQECHRQGAMAPMSLVSYEETRPWAQAIKERVLMRSMPPWHLDKTVGIQHFQNDMSLSDEQIATVVRWADTGALPGDEKDMPPPKKWPVYDGWQLSGQFGSPDLVIKSEPYDMPASGQDVWWKPLTPIPLSEPRWVRAVEIRPGSEAGREMVHHVLARLQQEEPDRPVVPDGNTGGPGMLMEWAIGKNYDIYRENTGKLLLPGAHIWWELHLHAVGKPLRQHAELAIYLYPKGEEPQYRTYLMALHAARRIKGQIPLLDIPPHSITQSQGFFVLKQAARLENFQPHMHLRGKSMSMEAILPDGSRRVLSSADNFTFNWMTNYIYADEAAPVLPKGTVLEITAQHDNTIANPNNPDPSQWVGWGDRTVDEMAHAWVNITYLPEEEYQRLAAANPSE